MHVASVDRIIENPEESMLELESQITVEVAKLSKRELSEASTPLQDKHGRPRWVRTRLCYCLNSRVDSCNIVARDECPSKPLDKTQRGPGKWLYATNPDFGKPLPEAEKTDEETSAQSSDNIVIS